MGETKKIRALERGLEVLLALQERKRASLHELTQATGLAKSTVNRILVTLEHAGFIHRPIGAQHYRISVNVLRIARHLDERDSLLEAAKPALERLCRKTIWPSDLLIRHDEVMVVAESSRALSPFNINRDNIGFRVNFVMSASGRAYLAFCPSEERDEIIDKLARSGDPTHHLAGQPAALARILDDARERRYALRDPSYGGGYGLRRPITQDGLTAIAVPVLSDELVSGVLSMVWFPNASSVEQVVGEHLGSMWEAADEIAALLPGADG